MTVAVLEFYNQKMNELFAMRLCDLAVRNY